jgi:hypothetical protein
MVSPSVVEASLTILVSPARLRRVIVQFFDDAELRDLCFDLDIQYEDLAVTDLSISSRVRALIEHCQRHRRLPDLVAKIRQERPLIQEEDFAPERTAESAPAGSLFDSRSVARENTVIIGQSLTALIRLLRSPEARTAVVAFQTDFQATTEKLTLLNEYKGIHDLFQALENLQTLILNDQRRLPADDLAWDNIMLNEPEVQGKVDDLVTAVAQSSFAEEADRWTQQLQKAQADLHQAVETFDYDQLQNATRAFQRVLNRQPSRLNAQLVNSARTLRLETLVEALVAVRQQLITADEEESRHIYELAEQFQDGIMALTDLQNQLGNLVYEHNTWQEIDDELRRIEGFMGQDVDELAYAWEDLAPMLDSLYQRYQGESWIDPLRQTSEALTEAIETGVDTNTRRYFHRFNTLVGRRFRHADFELLTLCQELQQVGHSLDLLLRNFR